jgi:hypothetical protein
MRHLFRALIVCYGCAVVPTAATGQATCRPIEGKVDAVRQQMVKLVTATDARTMALRDSLQLPSAQASDVVVVTDSTICHSAATAIAHTTSSDPTPTIYPAWVLKIGTSRYVVFAPEYDLSGEFSDYVIFDDRFAYLSTLVS